MKVKGLTGQGHVTSPESNLAWRGELSWEGGYACKSPSMVASPPLALLSLATICYGFSQLISKGLWWYFLTLIFHIFSIYKLSNSTNFDAYVSRCYMAAPSSFPSSLSVLYPMSYMAKLLKPGNESIDEGRGAGWTVFRREEELWSFSKMLIGNYFKWYTLVFDPTKQGA